MWFFRLDDRNAEMIASEFVREVKITTLPPIFIEDVLYDNVPRRQVHY